jgi:hypothetical protein
MRPCEIRTFCAIEQSNLQPIEGVLRTEEEEEKKEEEEEEEQEEEEEEDTSAHPLR